MLHFREVCEGSAIYWKEVTFLNKSLEKSLYFHPKWRRPVRFRSRPVNKSLINSPLRIQSKRHKFCPKINVFGDDGGGHSAGALPGGNWWTKLIFLRLLAGNAAGKFDGGKWLLNKKWRRKQTFHGGKGSATVGGSRPKADFGPGDSYGDDSSVKPRSRVKIGNKHSSRLKSRFQTKKSTLVLTLALTMVHDTAQETAQETAAASTRPPPAAQPTTTRKLGPEKPEPKHFATKIPQSSAKRWKVNKSKRNHGNQRKMAETVERLPEIVRKWQKTTKSDKKRQ